MTPAQTAAAVKTVAAGAAAALALLWTSAGALAESHIGERRSYIIGGRDAAAGAYPWAARVVARLADGRSTLCGGSLVSRDWVLTAAHCVDDDLTAIRVVLGDHDARAPDPNEQSIRVSEFHLHPQYDDPTNQHDLAMLRLETPALLSEDVQLVEFTPRPRVGAALRAIGWGLREDEAPSAILQEVDLPLQSHGECESVFRWYQRSMHLCAGTRSAGIDVCGGDSGGPLMMRQGARWRQIGVVGSGFGCDGGGDYTVYADAWAHLGWINSFARPAGAGGWRAIGAAIAGPIDCVTTTRRIDCFSRDPETGGLLRMTAPDDRFPPNWAGPWRYGPALRGEPSCVSFQDGRMDCVAAADGDAPWRYGFNWSSAATVERFGSTLKHTPECVATGRGAGYCFVVGGRDGLWMRRYAAGRWGDWRALGGALSDGVGCVAWRNRRIGPRAVLCMGRGLDGRAVAIDVRGDRVGVWRTLDLRIEGRPSCVTTGRRRVECFARGDDGRLKQIWRLGATSAAWGRPRDLSGPISSDPSCVSTTVRQVDCFARLEPGGDIGTVWYNGHRWGGWRRLGGRGTGRPDCVSWGPYQLACFARRQDGALIQRWHTAVGWGP